MAGKSREVETFVTKPPKNPGAGQVHSEYSTKTGEVDTFVTKPLTNPGAGQVYFECGSTHVFFTMTFFSWALLCRLCFIFLVVIFMIE